MSERHFHRCDCDACLNGSAGLRIPGAGAVFATCTKFGGKQLAEAPELREPEPVLTFSPDLAAAVGLE